MRILSVFIGLLLFTFANHLSAQSPLNRLKVPLLNGLDTLALGFAGGLNTPQISEVDLNNDGIQDLLVYDRSSQLALTFINNNIAGEPSYRFAPEYMAAFPQNGRNFMLARDFNCDGIADLFFFNQPPSSSGGIAVMKGSYDSNNRIQFTMFKQLLTYSSVFGPSSDIFLYNPDIPGIEDVDGDGDMDIAAFTLDFVFDRNVYYYRNTSADNGFGCDSLTFVLEHQCFGMFSESGANNTVLLSPGIDSCAGNPWWRGTPRHTGSSVTLVDYNNDGNMDLLMGDVSVNSLNMLTSRLDRDTLLMVAQDASYPSYDVPVNIFSYPSAYFIDVNNDGNKDMLAAPTEIAIGQAVTDSVLWYYKNTSSDTITLEFQRKDFLVGDMLDLGMNAYPAIVDVNGDGLLDLIVGHFAYTNSLNNFSSGLAYLQNIGTASKPVFQIMDFDYGGFSSLNKRGLYPCFGDLDNDGDKDLILGSLDGTLTYVRNLGGAGNAMSWAAPVLNYMNIDVGDFSAPQLIDIDRDGDLDLMIGEDFGNLNYFENKGTATAPSFLTSPNSSAFGFDLVSSGNHRSMPLFRDVQTDFELYLGNDRGTFVHLNNIDGNITGVYDTLSLAFANLFDGRYGAMAIADLNNDDTLDYVIGNIRGGLGFFTSATAGADSIIVVNNKLPNYTGIKGSILFPNPSQEQFYVRWTAPLQAAATIRIYDALGRLVQSHKVSAQTSLMQLSVADLPDGWYFVQVPNAQGDWDKHKLRVVR